MNTKKTPEKVKSMFSLKRYLKSKANERVTLLQSREDKRKSKLETMLAARKLTKAMKKANKSHVHFSEELEVTEEQLDHDHSNCGHNHSEE